MDSACFDTHLIFEFGLPFWKLNNCQQWVLELSNCRMSASLVTRFLYWYRRYICPCDLDLWNGYNGGGLYFTKFNTSRWFSFCLSLCISLSSYECIYFFWLFLSFSIYFSVCLSSGSRVDHFWGPFHQKAYACRNSTTVINIALSQIEGLMFVLTKGVI